MIVEAENSRPRSANGIKLQSKSKSRVGED